MARKQWMTIKQASEFLKVTDKTLRNRLKQKRYRYKRVRGKFGSKILLLKEDLEKDFQGIQSLGKQDVNEAIPVTKVQSPSNVRNASNNTSEEMSADELKHFTVVIADENENMVKLISGIVDGMKVVIAKNGLEALGKIWKCKPDLVVLEPVLPSLDGFQIALKMEQDKTCCTIPIIFCSYLKERSTINEGIRYKNVVRYFTKPLIGKQLKELKAFILGKNWVKATVNENKGA